MVENVKRQNFLSLQKKIIELEDIRTLLNRFVLISMYKEKYKSAAIHTYCFIVHI